MSDETEIEWIVPCGSNTSSRRSRVKRCLDLAAACARDFDSSFALHSAERECALPQFDPDELVLSVEPVRVSGFYAEYLLHEALVSDDDLHNGAVGEAKRRFSARSDDGFYSVKFLQEGIVEQDHAPNATTEMILEVKLLMSLSSHPNINKIYGITSKGINSLAQSGCNGYFFITDRVSETLVERMDAWRENNSYSLGDSSRIMQRLEIALDIASALVFLHDRKLVFYIRPDKVGFDARHGGVKLFNFGQARQHGMESHSRSVTQSDNMHTLAYTAPEVFCMVPAHPGTDVFGFGVLLWEMMSLERPFEGFDRAMHFEHVIRLNRRPLEIEDNWDHEIAEMLQGCWNPHKRPTMKKVHSKLETRLLFQEPSNEIQDTARKLKRHNLEGLVPQHDNETMDVSRDVVGRHSDGIVLELSSITGIPESANVDKPIVTVGVETAADQADSKIGVVSLHIASVTSLNVSAPNLNDSIKVDGVFDEVASSCAGPPNSFESNKSKGKRSKGSKGSKEKRRTRSKSRTRKWPHSNTALVLTDIVKEDEKLSTEARFTATEASANTLRGTEHYDVGRVDDEEEVIASMMSQSEEHWEAESQSETVATYDMSSKQQNIPVLEKGGAPAKQSLRNIMSRRRSKSIGGRAELGDSSESEGQASPLKAIARKERVKLSTQAVATQLASRVSRQRSASRAPIQEHAGVQRNKSDDAGMIRQRRASIVEVKRNFDFVPDAPKRAASSDSIKQLQNSLEKAKPITPQTPQTIHSPQKVMATVGKRMLGGILRIGLGRDFDQGTDIEHCPQPAPKPLVRRSSLVLDIVGQHQSFREADGKNTRLEKVAASQEQTSPRRASVF
jgi:serine/threonine protein kinase